MDQVKDHHLPRLAPVFYQGDAVIHWSLNIKERKAGWLTEGFHCSFRELMLHASARERLFCPTYCLMPDHMHIVCMGLKAESDQLRGMAFFRTHLGKRLAPFTLQHQGYDHVLGDEERRRNSFAMHCAYVLNNPVRAQLVQDAKEWRFAGAIVPGYPNLNPGADGFWETFWKLYASQCDANAKRPLPPRKRL